MNEGTMYFIMAALITTIYTLYAWYKSRQFDRPTDKPKEAATNDGPFKYPGYIPYKDSHGCYCARFRNNRDINNYFGPNGAGWLKSVVDIIPAPDGSIYVMYTNSLSEDMKEDLNEWSYNQHAYFQQKKEQRNKEREEATKKVAQEEKETKHFAEIGRKYVKRTNANKLLPAGSMEREVAEKKLQSGELDE